MEPSLPEGMALSGGMSVPKIEEKTPFSASRQELAAAVLLYFIAYLYVSVLPGKRLWLAIFALLFVAATELLYLNKPRGRESWVWLGCMALTLTGLLLRPDESVNNLEHVWNPVQIYFFLHVFAVWYVLSRGGRLLEGESGHLLPADALNGFVLFPFRHFFLRIRTVWYGLTRMNRRRNRNGTETAVWTAAAVLAALGLLLLAARLLMRADTQFAALLEGFASLLQAWDQEFFLRFLASLPVGAWLFGLLAGSAREDTAALRRRGEGLCRRLETLRKVPNPVWTLLAAAFCLLYLLFFAVQSRYLFGAFTRTLPEGFIVSQYARQGFFELCQVMAVNFALLWLLTRFSRRPIREDRAALTVCVLLLAESLLFAVVALSKLLLYIDCFGFTPRRLQSSWLVCVLALGCICALFSLLRGKKSFRLWLMAAAGSLSILCLF